MNELETFIAFPILKTKLDPPPVTPDLVPRVELLNRHLKAFAHTWNQRQLHNRAYPFDKKHVIEFVCLQD